MQYVSKKLLPVHIVLVLLSAGKLQAANFGTDLNLTMMPAAGGMGGTGIASPQDIGASVFGNPATLSTLKGTRFMFGGTYYRPDVSAVHDGSATGTAWSGESEAGPYLIPNAAVTQSLGDSVVLAGGVTVVAGVGSDFRATAGSLDPLAEILVFGANAGGSYRLSDQLSIGAMATIGLGLGQAGLISNTASTSNFGLRATFGMTYADGGTTFAAYYRTPLAIKYRNMIQYSATEFHSPTFEQPQEIAFGIANDRFMQGDLLLAADIVWKNWSSAEAYEDIYVDQTILAVGAQYTLAGYKLRAGLTHVNSPIKTNPGSSVGDIDSMYLGGGTVPFNPVLTQYVQATNAEVIWQDQISVGLGITLGAHAHTDLHASYSLSRKETIGATTVDAGALQIGAAFSWQF